MISSTRGSKKSNKKNVHCDEWNLIYYQIKAGRYNEINCSCLHCYKEGICVTVNLFLQIIDYDKLVLFFPIFTCRYLTYYKKYANLLNKRADQEVTLFLKDQHSIETFKEVSLFEKSKYFYF